MTLCTLTMLNQEESLVAGDSTVSHNTGSVTLNVIRAKQAGDFSNFPGEKGKSHHFYCHCVSVPLHCK